jgi:hypothetical protein
MTFFKTLIVASLAVAGLSSSAFAGTALSQAELKRLAPGRYNVTIYNLLHMTVVMRANGTVLGSTNKDSDSGHWTLNGGKLCIGFNKWLGGNTRCSTLVNEVGYIQGSGFKFTPL